MYNLVVSIFLEQPGVRRRAWNRGGGRGCVRFGANKCRLISFLSIAATREALRLRIHRRAPNAPAVEITE
jgi:hypothetical protein